MESNPAAALGLGKVRVGILLEHAATVGTISTGGARRAGIEDWVGGWWVWYYGPSLLRDALALVSQ